VNLQVDCSNLLQQKKVHRGPMSSSSMKILTILAKSHDTATS